MLFSLGLDGVGGGGWKDIEGGVADGCEKGMEILVNFLAFNYVLEAKRVTDRVAI